MANANLIETEPPRNPPCRPCQGNGQIGIDRGRGGIDSATCDECGGSGEEEE